MAIAAVCTGTWAVGDLSSRQDSGAGNAVNVGGRRVLLWGLAGWPIGVAAGCVR